MSLQRNIFRKHPLPDATVAFEVAETRSNISTGEKVSTVFGKIKKFFIDLTAPAFAQMITSADDLLATKVTGYVPDAKAVADTYTELNGKLGDKTLGVITDISSFIGSNYIIPSDGYIRLIPTSTSSPIGLTDIRNNTTLIEAHYITSIFVRKGITLKIDGSGRIGFIPLINK